MLPYQAIDYLRGLFKLSFSAVTKYFVGGRFSELKTNSKDKNSENSFCPKKFLSPYNKFVPTVVRQRYAWKEYRIL